MASSLQANDRQSAEARGAEDFIALAREWIARASSPKGLDWFDSALDGVRRGSDKNALSIAMGRAARMLGKGDLALSSDDRARAAAVRKNIDPSDWSVDQLARVAFICAAYDGDDARFVALFGTFCETAEINELIALYRGLPVYPSGRMLESRAREAIRSGMRPVFEAVAHRSPYPAEYFDEDAWNQMVVKAMFMGSSLWPIQGLDLRANPRLARMLVGLAQERWAAQRDVSPEIWRCVAPHADDEGEAALVRALSAATGDDLRVIVAGLKGASEAVREGTAKLSGKKAEIDLLLSELGTTTFDWARAG